MGVLQSELSKSSKAASPAAETTEVLSPLDLRGGGGWPYPLPGRRGGLTYIYHPPVRFITACAHHVFHLDFVHLDEGNQAWCSPRRPLGQSSQDHYEEPQRD